MSKFEKNRLSHFKVAIDSITVADFTEAVGLDLRAEVLEYREGGVNERTHKIAGQNRFTRITLARGSTDSLELFQWIQRAMQGTVERKNGAILACNQAGEVVSRYEFKDAWPCAYEGPNFSGERTEVAIERLTLAHRGWELKPGDIKPNPDTLADAKRDSNAPAKTDSAAKAPPKKKLEADGYPPRTPAAQKGAATACAAAERADISKRKVAALAVFTEEDEEGKAQVVHVGLSGGVNAAGEPTDAGKKRAADLQQELDKESEPPVYVVHDTPKKVPNYTSAEGDPAPGNCAEPKAADYEGEKDGFDVRYRGRDGDWEKGPNKYAKNEGDTPSETSNPQLKPCNTCQHNSAGIVGGGE